MKTSLQQLEAKLNPFPTGTGLIGLSGGADSIALLTIMAGHPEKIRVEAVHVNHGLRGAEADEDEAFARKICSDLHVKLHVYHPELHGKTDENSAREARFRCFRECMKRTGADTLILAHQADDQAETFMMRLMRGAGPEGLGCMRPDDAYGEMRILRPMLNIRREEIRQALTEAGISWREDSSNTDLNYLRNDLRTRMIPLMEEMIPGAVERIAGTAKLIGDENDFLEDAVNRFLRNHSGRRWIDASLMLEAAPALKRRILRRWWLENAPRMKEHALSAGQTEQLAELVSASGGKVNLPGGLHAVRGQKVIHLTGFREERTAEMPVSFPRTEFGGISMEIRESEGSPGNGKTCQEMPEEILQGCVIRTRREGDLIRPFGMKGTRKLQDYLTDRKVDEPWRDQIPLVCRDNEVILAAGLGAGNIPEWRPERNNVRICWNGNMPWFELKPEGAE